MIYIGMAGVFIFIAILIPFYVSAEKDFRKSISESKRLWAECRMWQDKLHSQIESYNKFDRNMAVWYTIMERPDYREGKLDVSDLTEKQREVFERAGKGQ